MSEQSVKAAGFSEVYGRYGRDVYRFALYLNGNAAWAEDIAAETFLRVWISPVPVRLATVKAYLLAIARNLYLRQVRRAGDWTPLDDERLPAAGSPEKGAEAREELRLVLRDLQQLPEIDRAAVLLHAADGLAYEEIAAILGLTVPTAKVKVHRARLKLAEWRGNREVTR